MTGRLRPALFLALALMLALGGAATLGADAPVPSASPATPVPAAEAPVPAEVPGASTPEDPRPGVAGPPPAASAQTPDPDRPQTGVPGRRSQAAATRVTTLLLGSATRPGSGVRVDRVQPAGVPVDDAVGTAVRSGSAGAPVSVLSASRPSTARFSAVGVSWRDDPALGPVSVAVRSRLPGRPSWSAWSTSSGDEGDIRGAQSRPGPVRGGAGVVWTGPSDGVEVSVTSLRGRAPTDVRVDLIDPGDDPGVDRAAAAPASTRYGTVLDVRRRDAWGADPRLMTWKPEYTAGIKAVVIHHTATRNDYTAEEVPAMLRSIYRFHAVSQGWGDIGYHIIVDRYGRAWEGRYGGIDRSVIGAHAGGFNRYTAGVAYLGNAQAAAPPDEARETIARAIAFKLGGSKVSPTATTMLTGGPSTKYPKKVTIRVPTVYPHQLTSRTTCPGATLLNALPALRERAAEVLDAAPTPAPAPVRRAARAAQRTVPPLTGPDAPTRVDAPAWVDVPAAGLTLHGKGFGHGRGMSQYGARGAATRGRTAEAILNHYYPGTRSTRIGARTVRTRLTAGDGGSAQFAPVAPARTVTGLVATARGGRTLTLPPAPRYRIAPSGGDYLVQQPAGRVWSTVAVLPAPVRFSRPSALRVVFGQRKSGCKRGAEVTFAGHADAVIDAGRGYLLAVQPLETYLRGVVSSEMPAGWPAAALQAQSVAARTYAVSRLTPGRFYDVVDTIADQCWDGKASEQPSTDAAIAATAGRIRTYAGQVINAQFSADNGGWSAAGGAPYLPARADPFAAAGRSPYLNWQTTLTRTQLAAADGPDALTEVTAVRVTVRNGGGAWGGRITTIELSGRTADGASSRSTVSGTHFRFRLGLRSTYLGFTPA